MTKRKKHIIAIVDDHSLFASSLEKLINSFSNFSVLFHAKNGLELQERIENGFLPEIILLDINMPIMDGFEATENINEIIKKGEIPFVPIVAMTANASPAHVSKCKASGMTKFQKKLPMRI